MSPPPELPERAERDEGIRLKRPFYHDRYDDREQEARHARRGAAARPRAGDDARPARLLYGVRSNLRRLGAAPLRIETLLFGGASRPDRRGPGRQASQLPEEPWAASKRDPLRPGAAHFGGRFLEEAAEAHPAGL